MEKHVNNFLSPFTPWRKWGRGCIIVSMISDKKNYYKGMRVNALGLPIINISRKSRSKKNSERKKSLYHISFSSPFKQYDPKNLIVMYDIPYNLKKERDWFRRQLINFGYIMIQKSVWVGPSPLPKEFLFYVKEIKLGNNLKTLKLAKSYRSSISAMA